jgi:poly-beta-1,6-N-acetyl-D-glucosamine synthase
MSLKSDKKYVLISAARNEQAYIEKTIQSVIKQTISPQKWIIVSDGSTDDTDSIVKRYMEKYAFIELLTRTGDKNRNFGSKAMSVKKAYEHIQNVEFNFVGNVDADISFDPDYYENMIDKFEQNPKLGIVGGTRYDRYPKGFVKIQCAKNSVGGPFQFFRKKCFDEIGGYRNLEYGGIDAVAETTARMYDWEVKSYSEYSIYHYRITGLANTRHILLTRFRDGTKLYLIGFHPIHILIKYISRIFNKPIFLGSLFLYSGYFWAAIRKIKKPVSAEFVKFLRAEQMRRLFNVNTNSSKKFA